MSVKKRVENFIDKGAAVKQTKNARFRNVLVRIPLDVLVDLNEALENKPEFTRTQWIVTALREKLKNDAKE